MKTLIILIFLGFAAICKAQNNPLEPPSKLRAKLLSTKTDTIKVNTMLKLAQHYYTISEHAGYSQKLDSAVYYGDEAIGLSETVKYEKGRGKSLLLFANICLRNDIKSCADAYATEALPIVQKSGTKNDLASLYLILGKGGLDQSQMVFLEKARKLFTEAKNKKRLGDVACEKGFLLMKLGNTKESLAEYRNALKLYEKAGYEKVQLVYALMALTFNRAGQPNEAIDYGLKAIKLVERFNDTSGEAAQVYTYVAGTYLTIGEGEKAIAYQKKAYEILKQHPRMVSLKITIETHLVRTLMGFNRYKEALIYLQHLERSYTQLPEAMQIMIAGFAITTYTELKQYKNAGKYIASSKAFLKSKPGADEDNIELYGALMRYSLGIKDYKTAREMASVYQLYSEQKKFKIKLKEVHMALFKIDSAQDHFDSAMKHYKMSTAYRDSVLDENKNKQIAELEIQYETDKKDRNNKLLTQKNQLQEAKLTQSNLIKNIGIAGVLLLLAFSGIVYRLYSNKKRANKQLELQKKEIDGKNEALQKLVTEKEWLLKEIHHRVKNNLQIIMSLLNIQSYFLEDDIAMTAIRDSQHRIHSMSLIHKKLYQSDNVETIDMPNYIKDLIAYFKTTFEGKNPIRFVSQIDPVSLDISQAVPLGLILNEAITNSIKHGFPEDKTGTITITLKSYENSRAELIISDDGVGGIGQHESTSLGMKLINGFASDLEAQLDVKTTDGFCIIVAFTVKTLPGINNQLSNLSA